MLKHLLVSLDETALSEKVLAHAESILEKGGLLTLVRVMKKTPINNRRDTVNNQILQRDMNGHARTYLQDKAQDLRRKGFRTAIQLLEGDPAEAIVHAAKQNKVDAIVIAAQERTGIGRWLQSSVARKVLDSAACEVIVVSDRMTLKE